ncbi:MAG: quinoprotein dehydrogenase-associated putative ABC transporter substrate-binding protein, partial [Geminicoccales bacterium]
MGFVRNTLRANRCDVIMGVVSADEMVQNTNPYYRSTYVIAHRTEDGARYASLDSPAMRTARIGVISATPPADLLERHGLLARVEPYNLVVDTRVEHPGRDMMEDLGAGRIDVALLWGPIAGYFAARQPVPITLEPLKSDVPGLRLDFRISMGVRSGETDWKHQLNGVIRDLKPQIDRILADYHVPLLNARGQLIGATPAPDHAATRPDPAGSRTGSAQ